LCHGGTNFAETEFPSFGKGKQEQGKTQPTRNSVMLLLGVYCLFCLCLFKTGGIIMKKVKTNRTACGQRVALLKKCQAEILSLPVIFLL